MWQCRWSLNFSDGQCDENVGAGLEDSRDAVVMDSAVRQLDEYFRGERAFFELPLRPIGTPFSEKVWRALSEIPYGETRSYSQVADMVGCHGGQRAVAQACSGNRLAVLVPCHRVIASNGKPGGYTVADSVRKRGTQPEGLAIKQFLLAHEQSQKARSRLPLATKKPKSGPINDKQHLINKILSGIKIPNNQRFKKKM